MALRFSLAELMRLLAVTEISDKNVEDWETTETLVFASRQLVKGMLRNMLEEYYSEFHNQSDYCLDILFQ